MGLHALNRRGQPLNKTPSALLHYQKKDRPISQIQPPKSSAGLALVIEETINRECIRVITIDLGGAGRMSGD